MSASKHCTLCVYLFVKLFFRDVVQILNSVEIKFYVKRKYAT